MRKEFIFKSMEKSSGGSGIVLPNHRDLSPSLIGFLDIQFSDQTDLSSLSLTASNLEKELNQKCEDLDTDLVNLRGNLGKIIVSWICRATGAKSALHKLNLNFRSISSRYGGMSSKMVKILGEDLPPLVKQLRQLDNVRNYSGASSKFEARFSVLTYNLLRD